jgi:hypothetical protein
MKYLILIYLIGVVILIFEAIFCTKEMEDDR